MTVDKEIIEQAQRSAKFRMWDIPERDMQVAEVIEEALATLITKIKEL